MNKQDLIDTIAEKKGLTKKESGEIVNLLFDLIIEKVANGEDVRLSGFGNFISKKSPERVAINPMTRKPINVPAQVKISFKPSETLKEELQK